MGAYQTTKQADAKLEELWLRLAQEKGLESADTCLDELERAFERLADGSVSGSSTTLFFPEGPEDMHDYSVADCFVIYRILEDQRIELLTVLQGGSAGLVITYIQRLFE